MVKVIEIKNVYKAKYFVSEYDNNNLGNLMENKLKYHTLKNNIKTGKVKKIDVVKISEEDIKDNLM